MYQKLLDFVEFKLKELILWEPALLVLVTAHYPVLLKILIAGYKIAHQPSINVLDIPGVLVPSIPDIETELKLALVGLNTRGTPLHWKHLNNRRLGRDSI
nr:short integuments 2, mitochondrial [Quercus suber]